MSKNFDETVRLQSEIRREWIRQVRKEKLQGIAQGASRAPVWLAHQPRRSLGETSVRGPIVVQQNRRREKTVSARSATEFEIRGKDRVARTERESDRRRREEKWQTCWCCRDQQRACRMAQASAEKLEHTGPAEKERVASVSQRDQLARTPEPPLSKGKGTKPSVQSTKS